MEPSQLQWWGEQAFVSLTTFRRDGTPVATAVWIARDGDRLVVITPAGSGKVKRLRRNSAVRMAPCSRRGTVEPDAPTVTAVAQVRDEPAEVERVRAVLRAKYGAEYRIFMTAERVVTLMRPTPRVALWIDAGRPSRGDERGQA